MINYTFTIDQEKLIKLTKKDRYTKKGYDRAIDEASNAIEDKAFDRFEELANVYGIGDSEIMGTMSVTRIKHGFKMGFDSPYAQFVEYGTGIVGKENPHPDAEGWIYQTNGRDGWFFGYASLNEGDANEDDYIDVGRGYYTRGQPSRPISYNTYIYVRLIAVRMTNNAIRRMLNAN